MRHLFPSSLALALLFCFLLLLSAATTVVDAIYKFEATLSDPSAYTFSTTTQPRAIRINLCFQFHASTLATDIATGSASVALLNGSTSPARTYNLRAANTDYDGIIRNTGTWSAGTRRYDISVRYVVEHVSATEANVWPAVKKLTIHLGAGYNSVKAPVSCGASFQFDKMDMLPLFTTAMTYAAARTTCQSNSGFLATWLKTTEKVAMEATRNTASVNIWHGLLGYDGRSATVAGGTTYCFREDPDFVPWKCPWVGTDYYSVTRSTCLDVACLAAQCSPSCARLPGMGDCNEGSLTGMCDWDSLAMDNTLLFCPRFNWDTVKWNWYDRKTSDAASVYAFMCSKLTTYPAAAQSAPLAIVDPTVTSTLSVSETATASESTSVTESDSVSQSDTLSESASVSDRASASFSRTPIITESDSQSMSLSQTITLLDSDSITETATVSITRTVPPSRTPTASRSHNETHSDEMSVSIKTATFSRGHNTSTKTLTESAPITDTQPSLSLSNSDPPSTPTKRRTKSVELTNFTALDTNTREPTLTVEIKIVKHEVPAAVKNVQTAVLAFALASGTGVAVVSQARLASAGALARCGAGEDLDKEFSFIESPLGLRFGQNDGLQGWRGALAGNFVAVMICVFANYLIGGLLGVLLIGWNKKKKVLGSREEVPIDGTEPVMDGVRRPNNGWNRGALRMRFPTFSFVIAMILQPPTASAAGVLVFHGTGGKDVIAGFAGGTAYLMISVALALETARRVTAGQCTLIEFTPEYRKAQRKKWQKRNVPACIFDVGIWLTGYIGVWVETAVYEWRQQKEIEMNLIKEKREKIAQYRQLVRDEEERLNNTANESINKSKQQQQRGKDAGNKKNSAEAAARAVAAEKRKRRRSKMGALDVGSIPKPKALTEEEKQAWLEWKQWQADTHNENERYPFLGHWGEIFDDVRKPYFFAIDFIVSSLQGIAAGVGAGPTSLVVCWVMLIGTISVCFFQFAYCFQRVGLSRLFHAYVWFSALVILVAFILAFVKFLQREKFESFESWSDQLAAVQGAAGMLLSIVTLGEIIDFAHSFLESLCCSSVHDDDNDDDLNAFVNEEEEKERIRQEERAVAAALKRQEEEEEERKQAAMREQDQDQFDFMVAARNGRKLSNGNDDDDAKIDVETETWAQRQARLRRQAMGLIRFGAAIDPTPVFAQMFAMSRRQPGAVAPPAAAAAAASASPSAAAPNVPAPIVAQPAAKAKAKEAAATPATTTRSDPTVTQDELDLL